LKPFGFVDDILRTVYAAEFLKERRRISGLNHDNDGNPRYVWGIVLEPQRKNISFVQADSRACNDIGWASLLKV
jgi:hypothetical protein